MHIGFGAVALLLPFLNWYQAAILAAAAVVFNIRLLRKIAGDRLHRPLELAQAMPAGLVLYPTSILAAAADAAGASPDIVAAAWGILAVGDGAATLVGRRIGGAGGPGTASKTVAGQCRRSRHRGRSGGRVPVLVVPAVDHSTAVFVVLDRCADRRGDRRGGGRDGADSARRQPLGAALGGGRAVGGVDRQRRPRRRG